MILSGLPELPGFAKLRLACIAKQHRGFGIDEEFVFGARKSLALTAL
jgi:hypothetical protein